MKLRLFTSIVVSLLFSILNVWADDNGTCGDNLTWNYVEATNTLTISGTGDMYNYDNYNKSPWGKYELSTAVISNGVTSIGKEAFYNQKGLSSVTIPNSVTIINTYAFQNCTSLSSISIPYGVTSIGMWAFSGCTNLTSLEIPNSVNYIGYYAFQDCTSLSSVTIPNSVTYIGWGAFGGCSGLTSIYLEEGNTVYDSRDNCNAIIETATNTLVQGTVNTIIPNSVTSIGDYAFSGQTGLTTITIPSSVTTIGLQAFAGCSTLVDIKIPSSVTSIGSSAFRNTGWYNSQPDGLLYLDGWLLGYKTNKPSGELIIEEGIKGIANGAFSYCSNLTSVILPNGITNIGPDTFSNCTGLTSVTLPNSLTTIGSYAFSYCSALKDIQIPNSVTTIVGGAFSGCSALKDIKIPSSVTTIGSYAFHNTGWYNSQPKGLLYLDEWLIGYKEKIPSTDLVIEEGTKGIASEAFYNCSYAGKYITTAQIPSSMISIGTRAFSGCNYLKSVKIYAPRLNTYGKEAFDNNADGRKIYVLAASLDTYKTEWPDYANDFIGMDESGIDEKLFMTGNQSKESTIFNISGQKLTDRRKGINIIDGKKVVIK